MARIKTTLEEIQKIVANNNKNPELLLQEVQEQLKRYQETNIKGFKNYELTTKEEQTLKQAEQILKKKIESQAIKDELQEKRLLKQQEKEIEAIIDSYIIKEILKAFDLKSDKKSIYQALKKSEYIKILIDDVNKLFNGNYKEYIITNYFKLLNKVYNIYKQDIKEQEQQEKEQEQYKKALSKYKQQKFNSTIKKINMFNIACIGLLTYANKRKRRY